MFSKLFSINLTETNETYIVSGINGRDIGKFISRVWKTSVLESYMFKSITGGRFGKMEFYKFFLIDVIYMLEKLASQRNPRVPVRTLNEIVKVLKEQTWFKDVNDLDRLPNKLDYSKLKDTIFKPLPHQQRWFEYYNKTPTAYRLKGSLANISMGGGKSWLATMSMWMAGCNRIIVVCPKNAVDRVWFNDPIKFFKIPIKIWNSGMNTTPNGDEQLFVYHYEAIDKILEHHRSNFNKFNYGFILDECHNLNDIKAQRTLRWLDTLKVANTSNIIHMSGTPLKAMGAEIIPLLRAIDPSFTPKVEERFKKIYGTSAQKGLDILKNRLGLISYVATKDEFQDDKPEIILQGIKIPDGDKYTLTAVKEEMKKFIIERVKYYESRAAEDNKLYRDCLAIHESKIAGNRQLLARYNTYLQYIRIIQNTTEYGKIPEEISYCKQYEFKDISSTLPQELVKPFRDVCSVIKYLTLKIQGECLGQVVGKMRVQAHVAMCDHIPFRDICQSTKKKTVVFTSFVEVLEKAMETCRNQELNPILVYGKTNKDLAGQVKKFEVDESVNPLIATYNSLSTAVPLIMADTMIMINAPFRAYIQEQAIARIHRLGQDSKCVVYQLYLDTGNETNISSRSLDIMTWSQQQVEAMTGVKSPYAIETNEDGSTSVSAESYFEGDLDSVYYLN